MVVLSLAGKTRFSAPCLLPRICNTPGAILFCGSQTLPLSSASDQRTRCEKRVPTSLAGAGRRSWGSARMCKAEGCPIRQVHIPQQMSNSRTQLGDRQNMARKVVGKENATRAPCAKWSRRCLRNDESKRVWCWENSATQTTKLRPSFVQDATAVRGVLCRRGSVLLSPSDHHWFRFSKRS